MTSLECHRSPRLAELDRLIMSSPPEGYLGQGVDPDDHLKTGWGSAPLKFTECTVVFGTHKCSRAECVARGFNKDPPPPHTHTHTRARARTHTNTCTHARIQTPTNI
jgi:hypothetical protein